MSKILCIYYSRSGKTKAVMEEIAQELEAELVELHDRVDRSGAGGWLRCGLDAVRRSTPPLEPFYTQKALSNYQLVVLGTPVWAGRCSAVMRGFLKKNGRKLRKVAYVATRSTEEKSEQMFDQMDQYVPGSRVAEVSLRVGSVGYAFWREDFLRRVREFLETDVDETEEVIREERDAFRD